MSSFEPFRLVTRKTFAGRILELHVHRLKIVSRGESIFFLETLQTPTRILKYKKKHEQKKKTFENDRCIKLAMFNDD